MSGTCAMRHAVWEPRDDRCKGRASRRWCLSPSGVGGQSGRGPNNPQDLTEGCFKVDNTFEGTE